MRYVTTGTVNFRGKILKRGEKLPKDATKEEINYFMERGAVKKVTTYGEVVEEVEEAVEESEEESEEETEEESEEESEEETEDEEFEEEAPEIDAMAGVVSRRRKRGGKS